MLVLPMNNQPIHLDQTMASKSYTDVVTASNISIRRWRQLAWRCARSEGFIEKPERQYFRNPMIRGNV